MNENIERKVITEAIFLVESGTVRYGSSELSVLFSFNFPKNWGKLTIEIVMCYWFLIGRISHGHITDNVLVSSSGTFLSGTKSTLKEAYSGEISEIKESRQMPKTAIRQKDKSFVSIRSTNRIISYWIQPVVRIRRIV